MTFDVELPAAMSFLGVKAVSPTGEEYYYPPVEMASLWGKLSKVSSGHKLTLLFFTFVVLGLLALVVRGLSRRGYQLLRE